MSDGIDLSVSVFNINLINTANVDIVNILLAIFQRMILMLTTLILTTSTH